MLATAVFCLVSALAPANTREVDRFDGFELQGVAYTDPSEKNLGYGVRARGQFPSDGVWSLQMKAVTAEDGSPLAMTPTLPVSSDVDTTNLGLCVATPMRALPASNRIRLVGDLVHYRSVEESATFPTVRLILESEGNQQSPHMRMWRVPADDRSVARTARGLVLRFRKVESWGVSGKGWDDIQWLPVETDPSTRESGLAKELAECRQTTVDRIDAYDSPENVVRLYRHDPTIESGLFGERDEKFKRDVALSLHVIRRIVERRIPFALVVPVQIHKDPYEEHRGSPDPTRFLIWPSTAQPHVAASSPEPQP